jgi:hypothetical protein
MAVQVHGHHRFRPGGEGPGHRLGGDVEGLGIDVGEDRAGPGAQDGQHREGRAQGGGDDLVAAAHAERLQRQLQGLGPVGHGHAVRRPDTLGQLGLQRLALRPQDEAAGVQHAGEGGVDLRAQRGHVGPEVHEGHAPPAAQR